LAAYGDFSPATGDYASTMPFAVGTMGSKDMDRSSTFLSDPAS